MRYFYTFLFSAIVLIFLSCSHSIKYTEYKKPLKNNKTIDKILVYEIGDPIPDKYVIIGKVVLGDTGFSHSCGYTDAIYLAKQQAREIGAEGIQVTEVIKPDFWSTCYRVEVNLLESK